MNEFIELMKQGGMVACVASVVGAAVAFKTAHSWVSEQAAKASKETEVRLMAQIDALKAKSDELSKRLESLENNHKAARHFATQGLGLDDDAADYPEKSKGLFGNILEALG